MLTDTRVKTAKPQEKIFKLTDERGLHLSVYPNGSKLWQMRYRFEGKQKTASIGKYPEVSLAEAREKRDQMRKQIANEIDPVEAKRVTKQVKKFAQENSFEAVARAWYTSWAAARSPRYADYVIRRLEADVFPAIGKRPVSEIKAPELVAIMKTIEKRGALDIAKRSFQTPTALHFRKWTRLRKRRSASASFAWTPTRRRSSPAARADPTPAWRTLTA
jgi:hypothetical protein